MQTTSAPLSASPETGVRGLDGTSFVAWSAIIAGAITAAAVSLILLLLGSGLGLAAVSPWSHAGVSGVAFTAGTAIWLIVMQWTASGLGGYLTGRLRHRWTNMHSDEIFFRDTAHGFLAWVLATIISAALLSSAVSSIVGVGAGFGGGAAAAVSGMTADHSPSAQKPMEGANGPTAYFVDSLYRSPNTNTNTNTNANAAPAAGTTNDQRGETTRILLTGMKNGGVSDADKAYLGQLVAARTGLSPADANARVGDVLTQMKAAADKLQQEADTARKAASAIAFYSFLSMLIGAFIAATAAALGGMHRDDY